eukprot:scaffold348110_cov24-Attheya_sp.AAC.1
MKVVLEHGNGFSHPERSKGSTSLSRNKRQEKRMTPMRLLFALRAAGTISSTRRRRRCCDCTGGAT